MDAFGVERVSATGTLVSSAVGFAGQYLDDATGMYDMRARDYDPTSGRFTATDPVQVPTGMPFVAGYTYGYNNPLMFTDANGLKPLGQDDYADGGSYRPVNDGLVYKPWSQPDCSQDPGRFPYIRDGYPYGPENRGPDWVLVGGGVPRDADDPEFEKEVAPASVNWSQSV